MYGRNHFWMLKSNFNSKKNMQWTVYDEKSKCDNGNNEPTKYCQYHTIGCTVDGSTVNQYWIMPKRPELYGQSDMQILDQICTPHGTYALTSDKVSLVLNTCVTKILNKNNTQHLAGIYELVQIFSFVV